MTNSAQNPKGLRKNNKSRILFTLACKGDSSRLALSRETGLTPASVTQLVQGLMADGAVSEGKSVRAERTGRREVPLHFEDGCYRAVGINIERDNTHISLCTYGNVISEEIYPTSEMVADGAAELLKKAACAVDSAGGGLLGIGVGICGAVDEKSGTSVSSYGLLPNGFPLGDELFRATRVRVLVVNNVRAQARSQIKNYDDDFMFVKHSPGLGCAFVSGGKIVDGATSSAGEIGHTVVDISGEKCRCGKRGCLETYLSDERICALYQSKTGNKLAVEQIYDSYGSDATATEILNRGMDYAALAIGNATVLSDPGRVLLTGGMFFCKPVFDGVVERLNRLGFDGDKVSLIKNSERIKAFSGARHIIMNDIFEV